jgi:hypothetical protein
MHHKPVDYTTAAYNKQVETAKAYEQEFGRLVEERWDKKMKKMDEPMFRFGFPPAGSDSLISRLNPGNTSASPPASSLPLPRPPPGGAAGGTGNVALTFGFPPPPAGSGLPRPGFGFPPPPAASGLPRPPTLEKIDSLISWLNKIDSLISWINPGKTASGARPTASSTLTAPFSSGPPGAPGAAGSTGDVTLTFVWYVGLGGRSNGVRVERRTTLVEFRAQNTGSFLREWIETEDALLGMRPFLKNAKLADAVQVVFVDEETRAPLTEFTILQLPGSRSIEVVVLFNFHFVKSKLTRNRADARRVIKKLVELPFSIIANSEKVINLDLDNVYDVLQDLASDSSDEEDAAVKLEPEGTLGKQAAGEVLLTFVWHPNGRSGPADLDLLAERTVNQRVFGADPGGFLGKWIEEESVLAYMKPFLEREEIVKPKKTEGYYHHFYSVHIVYIDEETQAPLKVGAMLELKHSRRIEVVPLFEFKFDLSAVSNEVKFDLKVCKLVELPTTFAAMIGGNVSLPRVFHNAIRANNVHYTLKLLKIKMARQRSLEIRHVVDRPFVREELQGSLKDYPLQFGGGGTIVKRQNARSGARTRSRSRPQQKRSRSQSRSKRKSASKPRRRRRR